MSATPGRAQSARRSPSAAGTRGVLPGPAWTPLVMAMIGAASSTCAHIARAVSPWSWATALARRASRRPATVMLNGSPPERGQLARHELAVRAEAPEIGERVHLVARRHRRVGGEDDALARGQPRLRKACPASIRSAISSMPAKTACPSLKW